MFEELIKRVKTYSLISFILPIFALNACLILFHTLGSIEYYEAINWEKNYNSQKNQTFIDKNIYFKKSEIDPTRKEVGISFIDCPTNNVLRELYYLKTDGKLISAYKYEKSSDQTKIISTSGKFIDDIIINDNQIKKIVVQHTKEKNYLCAKNRPILYLILSNSKTLENILIDAKSNYEGIRKIKNPYLYGEVSISRTARYFPATLIFKPLIILTAVFLFFYWINNFRILNKFQQEKFIANFSKKFFYFGVLSCIFLIIHATFLGVDFNSKIFEKFRRINIILFIFSEISAQILFVRNLIRIKLELNKFVNQAVIRIKTYFVLFIAIVTLISLFILAFNNPTTAFKHTLEWNYFIILLFFYLLSRFLWKIPLKP